MKNHTKARLHVGTVPFSWERKPGVSKVIDGQECPTKGDTVPRKLPPPPCPILEGPCAFQPPSRSSSKKGLKHEDPFLAAYKECTKSINGNSCKSPKNGVSFYSGTFGKISMPGFSCSRSCSVK